MNEEVTKYLIEISSKLGKIESGLSAMNETILKHEQRICVLEQKFVDSKTSINMSLIKILGLSLLIIAGLTGSLSIIAKVFNY